jgi:flagellar motor component MotA
MIRSLGFLAGLALFPLAIFLETGSPSMIINGPSLMLVLVAATLFTCASHGGSAWVAALKSGLGKGPLAPEECQRHRRVLESFRNSLCATGAAGFLLGLVGMLGNLSDPSRIGPSMAITLLTVLYALVIAELVVAPMASALSGRVAPNSEVTLGPGAPVMKSRGVAVIVVVLVSQSSIMAILTTVF